MFKPNVLVLTGYGINCDSETAYAFEQAGAKAEIVHVNDVIYERKKLNDCQILAFPGGFSHGDHTGAGKALAAYIRNNFNDELLKFVNSDKLTIGICNGFQVMVALGLLPALDGNYGKRQAVLLHNEPTKDNKHGRYLDTWVDVDFEGNSAWTRHLERMSLPMAHGEGKFYASPETLRLIKERKLVAVKYVDGEMYRNYGLSVNPNGALENIAGITDESGRIFGLMPHPERGILFTRLPDWTLRKEQLRRAGKEIPDEYLGIKIFKNGVDYFK